MGRSKRGPVESKMKMLCFWKIYPNIPFYFILLLSFYNTMCDPSGLKSRENSHFLAKGNNLKLLRFSQP
jgi:hypothetical protein